MRLLHHLALFLSGMLVYYAFVWLIGGSNNWEQAYYIAYGAGSFAVVVTIAERISTGEWR